MLGVPVFGVLELKATKSFRFALWVPETGFGAANWVLDVVDVVDSGGGRLTGTAD